MGYRPRPVPLLPATQMGFDSLAGGSYAACAVTRYGFHLAAWWLGVVVVLAQVVWHATLIKDRTRDGCFKAFRANHWVGFTLFTAIVVGSI